MLSVVSVDMEIDVEMDMEEANMIPLVENATGILQKYWNICSIFYVFHN